MGQQPPVHHGCLADGWVAADHVDVQARLGLLVGLVAEVAEVRGPVLGRQLATAGVLGYRANPFARGRYSRRRP
jgi:hypothetical protein